MANKISNKRLPSLHIIFRNLFGIINHQCPPLITDSEKEQKYVEQILKNEYLGHDLKEIVKAHSTGWKLIDFDDIESKTEAKRPKFSMDLITVEWR